MLSKNTMYLSLRLEAPLQSWGVDSQFTSHRNTMSFPSRSAILGMICSAKGLAKGSQQEKDFLFKASTLMMKVYTGNTEDKLLLEDYQIVRNALTPKGTIKPSTITKRFYLTDSKFAIVFSGDEEILSEIALAMKNPHWCIYLGRKCCIPTAPVFTGMPVDSEEKSMEWGKDYILAVEEVPMSTNGDQIINDIPLSFETRTFNSRKVKYHYANL